MARAFPHIPLHHVPSTPLQSTSEVLRRTVAEVARLRYAGQVHLDVETYTWSAYSRVRVGGANAGRSRHRCGRRRRGA